MVEKPHAFELSLTHRTSKGELISHNRILADDIVSLLSQFQMLIVMEMRRDCDNLMQELKASYDDIPF